MKKFSAILSLIVSLLLIVTGVAVAWLNPLADLLPNSEFASTVSASAPAGSAVVQTAPFVSSPADFAAAQLPVFAASKEPSINDSISSYSITDERLSKYSFGGDFYTEIYNATYKIFNQLTSMSTALSRISNATANQYLAAVATLRQLSSVEKQLVNAGNVLNAQYSLQLHNATLLNEVTRGLSTVSEQLHELSTLQTNANAPIADNLARISSILVLLVRLIGVLIGVIGLVMLCRSLWKLGEAFDAPKAHSVGA